MAQRLRPGKSSGGDTHHSSSTHPSKGAVVSDTELSDTEPKIRDRRASLDQNDRPGEAVSLSRNSSTKGFSLKSKTSFSFRRRGSKPSSTTSLTALPAFEPDKPPPVKSAPSSPSISSQSPYKGIGPTPAQSAYIQRILADPRDEHEPSVPLQRLRRANCGEAEQLNVPVESGLVESLKAFTSVEVLEGENAFACKKCWKVKTGRYKSTHATVQEEDEADLVASPSASPGLTPISSRTAPPSISIVSSDSASNRALSPIPVDGDTQIGRYPSSPSRGLTSGGHPARIPSPLGKRLDDVELASVATTELASVPSTETGTLVDPEYDGLSDTDTTDEEPPKLSELSVGRPKMPARKKSSHFVMHRAFKRYLIAKAPEVLVFHFKRFRQTHKTGLTFTSFYDLKKCVIAVY
jgi:ubiquitin carboxyl-terminal hydrolase 16/45